MAKRDNITFRTSTFSLEDQEKLLEESILEWQALGPTAAWQAMSDMLDLWFMIRGIDPETQRVDRTHIEIHPVPWLAKDPNATLQPFMEPKE